MKSWMKSFFAIVCFLVVVSVVGFYNIHWTQRTRPSLSLNNDQGITFPYDVKRFPNTVLTCKSNAKQTKSVALTVLTKGGGAALSFNVKPNSVVNKKVKKLLLKLRIKAKEGGLSLEKDDEINCFLKKVGDVTINEEDLSTGTVYLQDAPALINKNLNKIKSNNLIIYNTSLKDGTFKVMSYLEDGKLAGEEEVTVEALKSHVIKAKNNKPKTYHVTSGGDSFLVFVRKKIAGKFYISKPLATFKNSIFTPNGGVLVASNITSAPATFRYIVTSKNKKVYEGTEWVLPFGQRKISLSKLKSLSKVQMELTPVSYYYPVVCEAEDGCFLDESKGDLTLVMNYVSGKEKSPSAIKQTAEQLSDEIRSNQKKEGELDVSCGIDNVVKPYCDRDSNANGIDDAKELFHYFADPTVEDGDKDGFSNAEEIATGTDAFHPFDFPGVPKDNTIEGMVQLAELIESWVANEEALQNGRAMLDLERILKNEKMKFNQYLQVSSPSYRVKSRTLIEEAIISVNTNHTFYNNIIRYACSGINVCINSKYDAPETNRVADLAQGCLNVMRQAVGRMVGSSCRYCKGSVRIADKGHPCPLGGKENITINLGGNFPRSHSIRTVNLSGNDWLGGGTLEDNARRYTVCHELGHKFYWPVDRYNEPKDPSLPPSLYGPPAREITCLTGFDMFELQLMVAREQTGAPLSKILKSAKACTTKNGKSGKQINFGGYVGDCIEYPFTAQQYCPPSTTPESEFKPKCFCNTVTANGVNYCCESKTNLTICNNDCCNDTCMNSFGTQMCCKDVVKVDNQSFCCSDPNLEKNASKNKAAKKALEDCKKKTKCEPGETEYTNEKGERDCCPNLRVIKKLFGGVQCCPAMQMEGQGEMGGMVEFIACGGSCCPDFACLEKTDGTKSCCPEKTPLACPGSKEGCCPAGKKCENGQCVSASASPTPVVSVTPSASPTSCQYGDQCLVRINGSSCYGTIAGANEQPERYKCQVMTPDDSDCFCCIDINDDSNGCEALSACDLGNDCVQKLDDGRQCCGTITSPEYAGRSDSRCTEFDNGMGKTCHCCVDIKDDPDNCSHKCNVLS